LHLHPGTYVPNIYHMSMCSVLSVLSYIAFILLAQNYLCTTLPRTYTVVHKSLCAISTIMLLIPIPLNLVSKIHLISLISIHTSILPLPIYGRFVKLHKVFRASNACLCLCTCNNRLTYPCLNYLSDI
jgi:hypothetical protein